MENDERKSLKTGILIRNVRDGLDDRHMQKEFIASFERTKIYVIAKFVFKRLASERHKPLSR